MRLWFVLRANAPLGYHLALIICNFYDTLRPEGVGDVHMSDSVGRFSEGVDDNKNLPSRPSFPKIGISCCVQRPNQNLL